MTLAQYRPTIQTPLRQVTLCFLIKGDQVLLALKKRDFGKNKWNGVGGKPKPGETIVQTAIRETQEEITVTPRNLVLQATLDFYFPHNPAWNQQVIVFTTSNWDGEPQETEEMQPQWFHKNQLPFERMWADDKFWLPQILAGKKLHAEFLFAQDNTSFLDSTVAEIGELTV